MNGLERTARTRKISLRQNQPQCVLVLEQLAILPRNDPATYSFMECLVVGNGSHCFVGPEMHVGLKKD